VVDPELGSRRVYGANMVAWLAMMVDGSPCRIAGRMASIPAGEDARQAQDSAMARIYRTMKRADDDLPVVGTNAKELGVRIPPNPNADVDLDDDGNVCLNGKGMSVAENWRHLLPHLVPRRLRHILSGAAGSIQLACYKLGDGPFRAGPINDQLILVLKAHGPRGGNVVPSRLKLVKEFQDDLAATRLGWSIDET
jgi:hypothetical protein